MLRAPEPALPMQIAIQISIIALMSAFVYALIALGFTLVFGIMRGVKVRTAHAIGEGRLLDGYVYARSGMILGFVLGIAILIACRDVSGLLRALGTAFGVRGGGWATATTETLELAVMAVLLVRAEKRARAAQPAAAPVMSLKQATRDVAELGVPTGLQFGVESLAFATFTAVLGGIYLLVLLRRTHWRSPIWSLP